MQAKWQMGNGKGKNTKWQKANGRGNCSIDDMVSISGTVRCGIYPGTFQLRV